MKKYFIQKRKGFTLIEMIVVVAIIGTVTTIVLFNNAKLHSSVLVSNTAYEIGLIVRESQVAGLGVKASLDQSSLVTFSSSHGVHFDAINPTKIIMFADKNTNGIYDAGEMTQEYSILNKRSGSILAICGKKINGTGPCTTSTNQYDVFEVADITFVRPNPEAFFQTKKTAAGTTEYNQALIINVGFPNDICRSVIIEKSGAIQVDTRYCPPML